MPELAAVKQQNAAFLRRLTALAFGDETKYIQVLLAQPPDRLKELGSDSEVGRFRVEAGHRVC